MLIIKNINIVPMNEDTVLKDVDVLIENGIIKRIENNLPIKSDRVIDGKGKYLMPGLCDMHAHINSTDHFNLYLAHGVTTIRNMLGCPTIQKWGKQVKDNNRFGPDIYTTGPLIDGFESWTGADVVKTVKEAEDVVQKNIDEGYDTVKTYPSIPKEAFIALMKKANEEGLKVVGHRNNNVSIDELIELGYHSLEHASLLPSSNDEIKKLAKSGMWFSPTLVVLHAIVKYAIQHLDLEMIEGYEYVNDNERKEWNDLIHAVGKIKRMQEMDLALIHQRVLNYMRYSDNIILGTDNGNAGVIAGLSVHEELMIHVDELGLRPYEVLRMATINPARYLGLEKLSGTVEVGKEATLLILDGNPLENISNTRKIDCVIKRGEVFDSKAIENLKKEVVEMSMDAIEFAMEICEFNVD